MARTTLAIPLKDVFQTVFPPICCGCGRPSRGRTSRVRIHGRRWETADQQGYQDIGGLVGLLRSPGIVRLPVCWWHRWISGPGVRATVSDGELCLFEGIATAFAVAAGRKPETPGQGHRDPISAAPGGGAGRAEATGGSAASS